MKKTTRSPTESFKKMAKIMLASSALTLALAGAASAEFTYDQVFTDNDSPAISDTYRDILVGRHYYDSSANQYFSISLKNNIHNNTFYSLLIDNTAGGGEYNDQNGIDYYLVSKGNTTKMYEWNDGSFLESTYFGQALSNDKKTLTWNVKSDLGTSILWYATTRVENEVIDTMSATPIPAAAWLLGSGIIGLIGIKRRNQKG